MKMVILITIKKTSRLSKKQKKPLKTSILLYNCMRKRTLCKMLDWSTVGWADFVLFGVPLHTGKI